MGQTSSKPKSPQARKITTVVSKEYVIRKRDYDSECEHEDSASQEKKILHAKIVQAIWAGDLAQVQAGLLPECGIDINSVDSEGHLFLVEAVHAKQPTIVKWLLTQPDINVNRASEKLNKQGLPIGDTPLTASVYNQSLEIFDALLAHPNIMVDDSAPMNGETPLRCATELGKTEAVDKLLERGADANKRAKGPHDTYTPLIASVIRGYLEITAQLLASPKTDVNMGDLAGKTALYYAVKHRVDMKAINLLRYYGATHLKNGLKNEYTIYCYLFAYENATQFLESPRFKKIIEAFQGGRNYNLKALMDQGVDFVKNNQRGSLIFLGPESLTADKKEVPETHVRKPFFDNPNESLVSVHQSKP